MRLSVSIQEVISIHPSFFLSRCAIDRCTCYFECNASSLSALSNDSSRNKRLHESQKHILEVFKNYTRSEDVWFPATQDVGDNCFELDLDYGEARVITITLLPKDDVDGDTSKDAMDGATANLSQFCYRNDNSAITWVELQSDREEIMAKIRLTMSYKDSYDDVITPQFKMPSNATYENIMVHLTISLIGIDDFEVQSSEDKLWIMYEFVGAVVKSNEYGPSNSSFEPKVDEFQLTLHHDEIQRFFKENKIKMCLCKKEGGEGKILGSAEVDVNAVLLEQKVLRIGSCVSSKIWFAMHLQDAFNVHNSSYEVSGCQKDIESDTMIQVGLSLTIVKEDNNRTNDQAREQLKTVLNNSQDHDYFHCTQFNQSRERLEEKANALARAELDFDKRKRKWDDYRVAEEIKFQDYLLKKERALQNHLEHKIKQKELDQMEKIDTCRSEYKRLEARLKSALSQIEAKERELDRKMAANNTTFIQKVTELDLKDKLIQEEAKHTIDLEVSYITSVTD